MGKKLAIKGHPIRSEEVIKLLDMMGGKNINVTGGDANGVYLISTEGTIETHYTYYKRPENYAVFTLEEFLEKYPFKIGDKVHIYVQNDDTDGRYDVEVAKISSMRWNRARCKIAYKMKDINREFYKEEIKCKVDDSTKSIDNPIDSSQFMQLGKTVAVCFNTANYENEVELKLGDYEIVVRDGKTYAVFKKPKYPKTYEECCELLGKTKAYQSVSGYKTELLEDFQKLLICRDAYWKIAGEQMGLNGAWEPDWENGRNKCCIINCENRIIRGVYAYANAILAFPTEEMRDAFYENFKDLIEQCKELL